MPTPRSPRRRGIRLGAFVLAVSTMVLLACGEGEGGATFTPDDGVADGDLTVLGEDIDFDKDAYAEAAGTVNVTLANEGNIIHSLVIEEVDGFRLVTPSNGDTDEGTVDLPAGDYVIYCDIAGHRNAGMEATLTIEE